MMRAAIVDNGVVTNVVLAGDDWEPPEGSIAVASETAEIGDLYDGTNFSPPPPPVLTFEEARSAKLAAISAAVDAHLATGAPIGGLHVALDGDTRADINAVATAALGAQAGAPWPADFARGFITIENVRIPLPSAADGYAFASAVGDHYAQIRQHGRDLKDLAEAAETIADLDDINETAGWPG